MPRYRAQRMAELAPGIIAVEDASGECDALFDTTLWRFNSDAWQPTKSPKLQAAKLDVLPGKGSARPVSTINDMAAFARDHLAPIGRGGAHWHEKPHYFKH